MARLLPEATVEQLRGLHLIITIGLKAAADILLQCLPDNVALFVPEHRTLRLFLQMKEIHLAADFSVVALFGFLDHGQIGFELFVIGPASAVNALQHLVIAVAAPIGTGKFGQLERLAQLAGRGQMRPTAQIFPVALAVDGNWLIARNIGNDFGFVNFANLAEMGNRFGPIPHFTDNRLIALDNVAHALFDGFQIVQTERGFTGKIVKEAVFNHRPDGHLRVGE